MTTLPATAFTLSGAALGFLLGLYARTPEPPQDPDQRRREFVAACEGANWNGYAITSSGRFLCIKDGKSVDVYPEGVTP